MRFELSLGGLIEAFQSRQTSHMKVLRQLIRNFLRQRHEKEIDAQYERAYAGVEAPLGKDFEGWDNEGVWPEE
jgi:hypothetical protein